MDFVLVERPAPELPVRRPGEPRWPVRRYDPLRWRRIGWWPSRGDDEIRQAAVEYISATPLTLTAASGSVNLNVPTDATLAIVFWDGYSLTALNVTSMTLATVARTNYAPASIAGTDETYGQGCEYWVSPTTGTSVAFAWTWSGTPLGGEGPAATIVYFKGVDTSSPFRDGDASQPGTVSNSLTIDSNATDYVIGFGADWRSGINLAPTSSGQTNLVDQWLTNGRYGRLGTEDSPGASSTTFSGTGIDFGGLNLIAVSIKAAAGGGAASPPPMGGGHRNIRANAVYRMRNRIYVPAELAG